MVGLVCGCARGLVGWVWLVLASRLVGVFCWWVGVVGWFGLVVWCVVGLAGWLAGFGLGWVGGLVDQVVCLLV